MKHLILIPAVAIGLSACVPIEPTCGPVADVVIAHTKEGSPIYMQPPLLPDCVGVTPPNVSTPPVIVPPVVEPPVEPPVEPTKGNNGWGNGSQDAPGNSESHNRAENAGGNRDGTAHRPGRRS